MRAREANVEELITVRKGTQRSFEWLAIALIAIGLIYALLAGLRTVSDFDLGWQLASGRWVVQHHRIASTEVFSYTAAGQPWIYPIGSGLLFYGTYLLGGYALLSWLGALACVATGGLLLRRSVLSFALVVFAVPLIAQRTAPRADLFTVVLFAAFLRVLWKQHETGQARLWLLPLLMILWVNLHLGFIAGLVMLCGYVAVEVLEAIALSENREAVVARLRQSWPWLIATFFATLLNPWGWKVYQAIVRQESAMALHSQAIMEWSSVKLSWTSFAYSLAPRDPQPQGSLAWLSLFAAVAVLAALRRRRLGAAVLLAGSALVAFRHIRFAALFAVIVVIVGGAVLGRELAAIQARISEVRTRGLLRMAGASFIAVLASIRSADLVTDRTYLVNSDIASFGGGLSWWFPEGAAAFLDKTNPPGEIFESYNAGGFVLWRLGQKYHDYIDGRAIPFGEQLFYRNGKLLGTPPDSPEWEREAERYHINSIIMPLGRYFGVRAFPVLREFCNTESWVPVYLDETSAVFVRHTSETRDFIDQYRITCATAPLPAITPANNSSAAFNQWSNAAAVLLQLGRDREAFAATNKAVAIFPDSGYLHFLRGEILASLGNLRGAEQAYLRATQLQPNEVDWSSLARLYQGEGRFVPAMEAWEKATRLSGSPAVPLLSLGYAALDAHRPNQALRAFDRALADFQQQSATSNDNSFPANLAHGRALAWAALGDLNRAVAYQEETVRLTPERSEDWLLLSRFYLRQGRIEDAKRAREHAGITAAPNQRRVFSSAERNQ